LTLLSARATAHETLPGLLELREQPDSSHVLHWRRPLRSEGEVSVAPVFPADCRLDGRADARIAPDVDSVRGRLRCNGGLAGRQIAVTGWQGGSTAVLVRVRHVDGSEESHLFRASSPSVVIGGVTGLAALLNSYFRLGVEHILSGPDHLLFVAGLLLIVGGGGWPLVRTITAFTVAHSFTLGLAKLGYAQVPLPPVEVVVALSILFLAPEILRAQRGNRSFTIRNAWIVAFAFGLLHGFGFASGLSTVGLAASELPLALLAFNVGVEVGQLAFILALLLFAQAARVLQIEWPRLLRPLPAYVIGTLGAYWTLERSVALLVAG
jgi:hydrogenase/urease accessory protein HupE